MIVGAMRDMYDGKVPLDQAAVLFIKDLDAFTASARLVADDQATIVITSADAKPLASFKGTVSPQGVAEVIAKIEKLK
jgi:hypothetical protein